MAIERDLVDCKLTININVGLSYGPVPPTEEVKAQRLEHQRILEKWKDEVEEGLADKLAAELGYDSVTLEAKMTERTEAQDDERRREAAGRQLRKDQRAGR